MPQQSPSRSVRVFLSSTFLDMQEEREELIRRTFGELRDRCEARGVNWGEVDLRLGGHSGAGRTGPRPADLPGRNRRMPALLPRDPGRTLRVDARGDRAGGRPAVSVAGRPGGAKRHRAGDPSWGPEWRPGLGPLLLPRPLRARSSRSSPIRDGRSRGPAEAGRGSRRRSWPRGIRSGSSATRGNSGRWSATTWAACSIASCRPPPPVAPSATPRPRPPGSTGSRRLTSAGTPSFAPWTATPRAVGHRRDWSSRGRRGPASRR